MGQDTTRSFSYIDSKHERHNYQSVLEIRINQNNPDDESYVVSQPAFHPKLKDKYAKR